MLAAEMFQAGSTQAEVARKLRVSRQAANLWYKAWRRGGRAALKAAGRAGRKPRLTEAQKARLEQALLRGARAWGFGTELWTLGRVSELIRRLTGHRFSLAQTWRLLGQMGWSRQRPARRAKERDQAAIARWVKVQWPRTPRMRGKPGG